MSWVEKNRKINNRGGGDNYSGLESIALQSVSIVLCVVSKVLLDYFSGF